MKLAYVIATCCLGAGVLSGCYPVAGGDTPRTIPAGTINGVAGLEYSFVQEREHWLPSPRVAAALGVTDRVEVGGELAFHHAKAQARVQLIRDAVEVTVGTGLIVGEDDDATWDETGPDEVDYKVSRTTLYVGTSADKPVSVFVAPMFDIGRRTIHWTDDDYQARSQEAGLMAPGVRAGLVFALAPNLVRICVEAGFSHHVGLPGKFIGEPNWHEWQTDLGQGDERVGLYLGFLFGPYKHDEP